ncbi:chromate transporter [Clostridium thermosuccinogenes]|jgi:chromate transporter|uniref:Chromate transporter n=1 Tax=Clostridium thermosuccinogenes TaxID=84032 RepID=A0A2K2FB10_9CLOT|nr:chromate transporter [Pseudoclostridium thermosuccinogenes]AUS97201.1 chromate transporter [Pseudoclostridium thermosuccinogenes]PNT92130.1 chromate transporter [Pseudoclostridium thermosuccinogenes]PNT95944.1 chromate transporter [Pseudoclostridium thermosuccinogenes]PNT97332.1 chromate transporter [Pseudoclostridium thermosuccinogenes]
MTLIKLFWSFFQIGLFSIGGGMAAMPLIQNQVVNMHQWLTLTEFTDLITIAEMTPGPIAINSATFVGIRIAGIPGAIIATIGCILPSCAIVSLLAWLYFKYKELTLVQGILSGLRPTIVALIASAGLSIFILAVWGEGGFSMNPQAINLVSVLLFSSALFILRKWKPNPIFVMLGSGIIGGAIYLII